MNRPLKHLETKVSRRQVMVGAAGLSFAIALAGRAGASVLASARTGKELSPWVSIAPDGTISIVSAATEMGQGSMTSLPLILAEELDADWSKVKIVTAPPIEAIYGNPGFQGMMYTAGSNAVTSYYTPLRIFGAQVRRVLLDNAAKTLGVPVDELTTEPSTVVHAKSGRRLSYGEIAATAQVPAQAPDIKPEQLKKAKDFRLITKDVMRVELPGKVNGTALYSIDQQVPNMLYGTVLRAPVEGSVPDKIADAEAKAIAGVVRVVRLPYGVGVLAETPWAAFDARRALTQSVTWSRTGTAWGFDSDKGIDRFAADAKNPARMSTEWSRIGDPRGAMPKAVSTMEAEYRCDYAYHAQMEPLNAIASVSPAGDAVEIWAGTQSQTTATEAPAKLLGIPKDKVKLHDMLMGGGFGRRGNRDVDFIIDAVLMSKEAGRPVKGDVDARGRHRERSVPSDLRPRAEGGVRPVRQAHRLAASHRRRPRRGLYGSGALSDGRRQGFHCHAGRGPQGLRRAASTGGAALSRHRGTHQSAARDQLPGQPVCHRVVHRRNRAQAWRRSARLPSRAP